MSIWLSRRRPRLRPLSFQSLTGCNINNGNASFELRSRLSYGPHRSSNILQRTSEKYNGNPTDQDHCQFSQELRPGASASTSCKWRQPQGRIIDKARPTDARFYRKPQKLRPRPLTSSLSEANRTIHHEIRDPRAHAFEPNSTKAKHNLRRAAPEIIPVEKLKHTVRKEVEKCLSASRQIRCTLRYRSRRPLYDPRFPYWLHSSIKRFRTRLMRVETLVQSPTSRKQAYNGRAAHHSWNVTQFDPHAVFLSQPMVFPRKSSNLEQRKRAASFCTRIPNVQFAWFSAFALVASLHFRLSQSTLPTNLSPRGFIPNSKAPKLRFNFERYIKKNNARLKSTSPLSKSALPEPSLLDVLVKVSPRQKRRHWMSILLFVLHHDLQIAAKWLSSMLLDGQTSVPSYAGSDAIALICYMLLGEHKVAQTLESVHSDAVDLCLDLAIRFLKQHQYAADQEFFSRTVIGLLAKRASGEKLEELTRALLTGMHRFSVGDRLWFVTLLTRRGKADLTLELLRSLSKEAIKDERVTVACTEILLTEMPSKESYLQRTDMLTTMLELGVRPDERMRDAIISLAILGGDLKLAWDSHDYALRNGIAPTVHTYCHLLSGIDGPKDLKLVLAIRQEAKASKLLSKSPVLGTVLIGALDRVMRDGSFARCYDVMSATYAEIFHLTPLLELGIVNRHMRSPTSLRISPTSEVLRSMLIAWTKACKNSHQLQIVFERWQGLAALPSSRLALTAYKLEISRAFLTRFIGLGEREKGLEVMKQILSPKPQSNEHDVPEHIGGELEDQLLPRDQYDSLDAKTDAIYGTALVKYFSRHGRMSEAENVIRVMKERGLGFHAIVYETLLSGYTRLQDIPGAVSTLRRQERAGIDTDEQTVRSLSKIRDRASLRKALQEGQTQSNAHNEESDGQVDAESTLRTQND